RYLLKGRRCLLKLEPCEQPLPGQRRGVDTKQQNLVQGHNRPDERLVLGIGECHRPVIKLSPAYDAFFVERNTFRRWGWLQRNQSNAVLRPNLSPTQRRRIIPLLASCAGR